MRTIRILLALLALAMPAALLAQVRVSVTIAPPVLPIYEQPLCPGDGYLWTPGYWAWDDSVGDYYWVPGTWVLAPEVGFFWTPGYWGWGEGGYFWNEGWWGPSVGFYGGITYGFGYFGVGFEGGRWDGGHFFYNRSVSNVDVTIIHNVYNTTVVNNTVTRVSYNGGNGGVIARPTPQEHAAAGQRHLPPVQAQVEHAGTARANPQMRATANHGNPPIAATARPGDFSEHSVVAAHGAENARAAAVAEPRNAVHPNDLPAFQHPAPLNSSDAKANAKYQKQQEKLIAKQQQERDQLQQKQEAEHQKKMNDAQKTQLEAKHQQQTQQLYQRHTAQQQSLTARQPAPVPAAPARK